LDDPGVKKMAHVHVVGLTLCERFEVKPKPALVGLFHARRFKTFPTDPATFVVYTGLYGKSAEGTMELAVSRLEGEVDLFKYKKWLTFPQRFTTVNLMVPVRCIFSAAGLYSVSLRFDDDLLSQRDLEIFAD
jgi:hypothetical protein